jgi:hypothetical protein
MAARRPTSALPWRAITIGFPYDPPTPSAAVVTGVDRSAIRSRAAPSRRRVGSRQASPPLSVASRREQLRLCGDRCASALADRIGQQEGGTFLVGLHRSSVPAGAPNAGGTHGSANVASAFVMRHHDSDWLLPIEVGPDHLAIPTELAGDGRDRPPRFFSACASTSSFSGSWGGLALGRRLNELLRFSQLVTYTSDSHWVVLECRSPARWDHRFALTVVPCSWRATLEHAPNVAARITELVSSPCG